MFYISFIVIFIVTATYLLFFIIVSKIIKKSFTQGDKIKHPAQKLLYNKTFSEKRKLDKGKLNTLQ